MADIRHWIRIAAPPETVYDALTTQDGLTRWWTADVEAEPKEGSVALFGFENRSVVFRMRVEELKPPARVRWRCEGDFDEWEDTELEFELRPTDDGGTEVFFTHADWRSIEGTYRQCNTDWGRLMYFLKDYAEGRGNTPMMR